jgi:hypothetical protein
MLTIDRGIKGFKVLQPSPIVGDLIALVEDRLPLFTSSNSFSKILVTNKNETRHSRAFILFMMKDQDKYTFMNETGQKGTYTIDTKVLPTPPGTKANPRSESEYVYADTGHRGAGIQRFKMGNHGVNDLIKPLPINGMIAYIKENDYASWHTAVNNWIKGAKWDASEELQAGYISTTAKFISQHLRSDGSELTLHHFWVKVS